jgi:hypothetical protein
MSSSYTKVDKKIDKIINKLKKRLSDTTETMSIYDISEEVRWSVFKLTPEEKKEFLKLANSDELTTNEKKLLPTNTSIFIDSENSDLCEWIVENVKLDKIDDIKDFIGESESESDIDNGLGDDIIDLKLVLIKKWILKKIKEIRENRLSEKPQKSCVSN